MIDVSTSKFAKNGVISLFFLLSGCGVFATQKDHDLLAAKNETLEKSVAAEKAEVDSLKTDLAAERDRLDNALRANADRGFASAASAEGPNLDAAQFAIWQTHK